MHKKRRNIRNFYQLKQEFTRIDFCDVYISVLHSFQDKIQKATKTKWKTYIATLEKFW